MTAILIEVFWKSGALLGIALLAVALLRKQSADLRRLVLTAAIVALFVMAAATFALPRWNAEIPAVAPPPVAIAPATQVPTTVTLTLTKPAAFQSPSAPQRRLSQILPIVWLTIAALLLIRFATSLYSLRRLRRGSLQISTINNIPVLQNDAVPAPVTWGILRPVILVPANFEHLTEGSRTAILNHELAHIQSHDFFFRTLAEIARALIWIQPLIWIARRHLREEQEVACDNRVLETGCCAQEYAKLLLNWNAGPEIAVGMAHRSCLKKRLYELLDGNASRKRASWMTMLTTVLFALGVAIPLAAISFTSANPNPLVITLRTPAPPPLVTIAPHPQPQMQLAQNLPAQTNPQPAVTIPAPSLTANSFLAITDVAVTDKTTHAAITGLGVNDFILTEDGVPQTIRFSEFQQLMNAGNSAVSSYYVIGYYTSNTNNDGRYRKIGIRLRDQTLASTNATLDFRAGFFVDTIHTEPGAPSASAPDSSAAAALTPGVTSPVLVYKVDPDYSDIARKAKYSGSIDLNALVDEAGKVSVVNVVHGLGMGLDQKALEAVRQWEFTPATQNGKPVSAQVQVSVNFRLL